MRSDPTPVVTSAPCSRDNGRATLPVTDEGTVITATEHDVLHAAAAAVARDLGVAWAAIELACAPELRAEHGARTRGPLVTVPLSYRSVACGRVHVAGPLDPERRRRLDAIAAQLALLAELTRRNREDKRRYLHEDLGQTLAAMAMTLDAAANLLARDPSAAERLVRRVRDQSRDAILDVRRIVSRAGTMVR
jgi:signal transduction histidine kinase